MQYLQVVDWDIYQTYRKDRGTPPWIKVHRTLLTSQRWSSLSDGEKGVLVSMWLVAAAKKGILSSDPQTLRKICLLDEPPNIQKFIELGYVKLCGFHNDNQVTTTCQPSDVSETETETETETEKHIVQKKDFALHRLKFEKIWQTYPAKKGKEKAWLKFKNQVKSDQDFEDIQKALKNYIADVKYIRNTTHPDREFQNGSTWFHQNWKDYINLKPVSNEGSPIYQATQSRGPFVDKVLKEVEEILSRPNSFKNKESASQAFIETAPDDEKLATGIILYNYSYIEVDPRN